MLKPKKIRVRSELEIAATVIAYKNLYRQDPYLANMMLLCSELSEYIPIPLNNEEELKKFIEANQKGLVKQFIRRFKSIDERAIPLESPNSPGDTASNSGTLDENKISFPAGAFAGPAGGMGRA